MSNHRLEPEINIGAGAATGPGTSRLPYEPPRLVHLGSFRDLTKGGGLTGTDAPIPFGLRPG